MEAELLQLAREAVAALEAGPPTNWVEIGATVGIGLGQIGVIVWGLWRMGKASEERNRQLDQQGETLGELMASLREQTRASSEALAELLRRTA